MQLTSVTSEILSLVLMVAAIGLLPFVAMVITSYAKIVVVLGLVRNALGVQQVPPNMVLNGVAMLLSVYIMAPVGMQVMDNVKPGDESGLAPAQVLSVYEGAREPMRQFLDKHAGTREKAFFLRSAAAVWPQERAQALKEQDLLVLAPAFLLTELTEAFKIGFLLYMAFIVVDLIIANVLLALGLSQVTPTIISIPFKLLLFVALDGWSELMHGMVLSYR
jgi:type III secretion protein R